VDEHHIQVIGTERLQADLHRATGGVPRIVVRRRTAARLGRQGQVLSAAAGPPPGVDGQPDGPLGLAALVGPGRVHHVQPLSERGEDGVHAKADVDARGRVAEPGAPEAEGPHAQGGIPERSQFPGRHRPPLASGYR